MPVKAHFIAIFVFLVFFSPSLLSAGQPFRIAYYQGGDHWEYDEALKGIIKGLMHKGRIEAADISELETAEEIWEWASQDMTSKFLRFVDNAFYNAKWGKPDKNSVRDPNLRKNIKKEIIRRLQSNDFDLIIAAGTDAGKDLANNGHSTPVIVIACSDPVRSGVVKSIEDSGFDHVHARVDPHLYRRQIAIFHDVIGFKKLGMVYLNTPEGRTYAALDIAKELARERNFTIVEKHFAYDKLPTSEINDRMIAIYKELCLETDAIYVTIQTGINDKTIPELVKLTRRCQVPTFSMAGEKEVRAGFLLSIAAKPGFTEAGLFHAGNIIKILTGKAKPRELNQVFEPMPRLAINKTTAGLLEFNLDTILNLGLIYEAADVIAN